MAGVFRGWVFVAGACIRSGTSLWAGLQLTVRVREGKPPRFAIFEILENLEKFEKVF